MAASISVTGIWYPTPARRERSAGRIRFRIRTRRTRAARTPRTTTTMGHSGADEMTVLDRILRRSGAFVALAAVAASCLFGLSSSTPASAACPLAKGRPAPLGQRHLTPQVVCGEPPPPPDPATPTPAPPPPSDADVQALVAIANSYAGACAGADTTCT